MHEKVCACVQKAENRIFTHIMLQLASFAYLDLNITRGLENPHHSRVYLTKFSFDFLVKGA